MRWRFEKRSEVNDFDAFGQRPLFPWILLTSVILLGFLVFIGYTFIECSERFNFLTANVLNLLIFVAIAVQAYIYRQQWKVMESQWLQNKRLIKASEDSAVVAREAFHVGEAPYFGVTDIEFLDLNPGYYPRVNITFKNVGRSPAWHFHADLQLVFGVTLESGQTWDLTCDLGDVSNSFVPQGESRQIEYRQIGFQYTPEKFNEVDGKTPSLFVVVKMNYMDMRKKEHPRTFRYIWHRSVCRFGDYDAAQRREQRKRKDNPN